MTHPVDDTYAAFTRTSDVLRNSGVTPIEIACTLALMLKASLDALPPAMRPIAAKQFLEVLSQ